MIRRHLILALFFSVTSCLLLTEMSQTTEHRNNEKTTVDSISDALEIQMKRYPASQYRDVYKNFMQDFFGPGHILSDTASAGKYLRYELAQNGPFEGPLYEKTGYRGNFYRVNLSLILDSIVPYETFFTAFVNSVQGIVPPSVKEWRKTWSQIDKVITSKGLTFLNEDEDRKALSEQFEKGEFVMHHSKTFNDSVHFHYRIMSKSNFENNILPFLNASSLLDQ